ncbi:MAG: hypothetical protein HFF03_04645 [Oscillospiraceae bacterium]|jgi:hypothetical protein|nr:hypothetical protein [Oscillospiraceae bacterium]
MRKGTFFSALAFIGGAVGFGLRRWQLAAGFEPETGLPVPGAASAWLLVGWSVLLGAVILLLCRQEKERMPWDRAFAGAGDKPLFLTAIVLSAFLLLVSAGAELMTLLGQGETAFANDAVGVQVALTVLPPLRIALCFGGFLCTLLWLRALKRGEDKGKESLALLELCFFFCVWLVSDYQARAVDPVVFDYVYEIFAIVFGLLGIYQITGYSFQEGKPRRSVFFCLMGAYFALVTLADRHSLTETLRYGFLVLFLTAHAWMILNTQPAGKRLAKTEAEKNG